MIWKCFLCLAAQKLRSTADLTKCYFYATITTIVMPNPLKSGLFSCWKAPVLGLRISEINNKSSKIFRTRVLERQMAQPRGKLTAICSLMSFPHPLQNRVPRVRILLPLPKTLPDGKSDWSGIPWNSGLFRVLGRRLAVYCAVLYGVYFALFSHPVPSVSNLSVWHSINKSSKFRGASLVSLVLVKN